MKPLSIQSEAEAELRAAIEWYEQERAGKNFELADTLRILGSYPTRW